MQEEAPGLITRDHNLVAGDSPFTEQANPFVIERVPEAVGISPLQNFQAIGGRKVRIHRVSWMKPEKCDAEYRYRN
jgi:hypothetical protein